MGNEFDGTYVVVEGLDGSGTTSVAERLHDRWPDAVLTAEPWDDHWTGQAVRTALTDETSPTTDLFLFLADRSEHLERVVVPALEAGRTVISDRSAYSTYAYQSHRVADAGVHGDPWGWFDEMYAPWDVEPDLAILLDCDVGTALSRADRDEKYEEREFLEHVASNYTTLAGMHDHFEAVDATRPLADVASDAAALAEAEIGAAPRPAPGD